MIAPCCTGLGASFLPSLTTTATSRYSVSKVLAPTTAPSPVVTATVPTKVALPGTTLPGTTKPATSSVAPPRPGTPITRAGAAPITPLTQVARDPICEALKQGVPSAAPAPPRPRAAGATAETLFQPPTPKAPWYRNWKVWVGAAVGIGLTGGGTYAAYRANRRYQRGGA